MFKAIRSAFGALTSSRVAKYALGGTAVAGLGYYALSPRRDEIAYPSAPIPTPEDVGARAAVEDFSRQLEAAQAARMNPDYNLAMPQIDVGVAQHQGMAGPEMAMGAGRR